MFLKMVSFKLLSILAIFILLANAVESTVDCDPIQNGIMASASEKTHTYIVILDTARSYGTHFKMLKECLGKKIVKSHNPENIYPNTIIDFSVKGSLTGYSGKFTKSFVKDYLSEMNEVLIVQKNIKFKLDDDKASSKQLRRRYSQLSKRTTETTTIRNLDRVDQPTFPLNRKYSFPDSAGQGVDVYILDTGINVKHVDFGGRARFEAAFCAGCNKLEDDNGHGTHVAGIVGGRKFGVAKKTNLIAVKVLGADGSGDLNGIIRALSFVIDKHKKSKNKKSVINMSLGIGQKVEALNMATKYATDAGIHVVVSAGNSGADACNASPASTPEAITVGATENESDEITNFSNRGPCLDIFAPGRNIMSTGSKSPVDVSVLSGTSFSSPHVAGAVALIISKRGNKSPAKMNQELLKQSTKGVVGGLDRKTPNNFLRVEKP